MQVEFAFLADHAVALPDGKAYVLGAGVDQLNVGGLPAVHPSLALVFKLRMGPGEARAGDLVEIAVTDPLGKEMVSPLQEALVLPGQPPPGTRVLVVNYSQLRFERAGRHLFAVKVGGVAAVTLALQVVAPATADAGMLN